METMKRGIDYTTEPQATEPATMAHTTEPQATDTTEPQDTTEPKDTTEPPPPQAFH